MQYRPTAAELLDAVAALLEDEIISVVPAHLQHQVRVAANVCRIVQRESRLGITNDSDERERLAEILGDAADLVTLRAALAARLDNPAELDDDVDRAILDALIETLRADLQIAKPGYCSDRSLR